MTDHKTDWQLVHKILYGVDPISTVVFGKFVDRDNMKHIKIFVGAIYSNIEYVTVADIEDLVANGVEISPDSLEMFLKKDDYEELDLLSNDDLGLAIRLKD